ncbi:DUF2490 domain-containing protein [Flavobacterium sp. GSP27]|uniref:DUF2490 domain-containing protein n=1 Tax=unclassified Flavobacterium TaxID=196869 RepID=UPI000F83C20F|nr:MULTISPECIES: DUF2490 domain-containing protein [unclassified Flavobacterium]RTZ05362.1 DUF2490 domain-containing protein [Flavobacterium sp. GSP6]RTZ05471.1 DUF2490 domain-containing protein [Flavobacterium sp. GSP27]
MKTIRIILFLFVSLGCQGQSSKIVDHQSILWTRYYNQLSLNEKWSLHSEFDNRLFVKPIAENLYVIRVQGRYKINDHLETGVGFAYFSVDTQVPEINFDFEIPEYRGQQDITWKKIIGKVTFHQRFQLEERFIHNASKTDLSPGTSFSWRFRYRLQGDYTFWKKEKHFVKAILSDEVMVNFGKKIIKNTFDQNRIYIALQYGFNPNIALELGYLNSFQQRSNGIDYFNRNIIRFSILHKIRLQKKNRKNY